MMYLKRWAVAAEFLRDHPEARLVVAQDQTGVVCLAEVAGQTVRPYHACLALVNPKTAGALVARGLVRPTGQTTQHQDVVYEAVIS